MPWRSFRIVGGSSIAVPLHVMPDPVCPICQLPRSPAWIELTPPGASTRALVCPRCTAAVTEGARGPSDPLASLRRAAAGVASGQSVVIEVPNLLEREGDLISEILRIDVPVHFTARALVTACRRVGLLPVELRCSQILRVVCRAAPVSEEPITAGPDAEAVAEIVWSNDLRRGVELALRSRRPSPEALKMVSRIHRRCPSPDARADIAIMIADSHERCGSYRQAARWLARSLVDRQDPQVSATLAMIHKVLATLTAKPAPAPAPPPSPQRTKATELRLAC